MPPYKRFDNAESVEEFRVSRFQIWNLVPRAARRRNKIRPLVLSLPSPHFPNGETALSPAVDAFFGLRASTLGVVQEISPSPPRARRGQGEESIRFVERERRLPPFLRCCSRKEIAKVYVSHATVIFNRFEELRSIPGNGADDQSDLGYGEDWVQNRLLSPFDVPKLHRWTCSLDEDESLKRFAPLERGLK